MDFWGIVIYALLVFYFLLVIATVFTVLHERRDPVRALSWIAVIVLLPFAGMVLFVFFGQDYRKQKIFNRKEIKDLIQFEQLSYKQLREIDTFSNPEVAANREIITLLLNNNKSLLTTNNRLEVLNDGSETFASLIDALRKAESFIHLEYYIFENDELGGKIADILKEKARSGVEVRFIYDDVGSWNLKRSFIRSLRDAGVQVHCFMPVVFPWLTSKINYRNHRKVVIIDGKKGYLGGMNVADRYREGVSWGIWRDTHIRIEGNAVHELQSIFLVDWNFTTKELLSKQTYFPKIEPNDGKEKIQLVTSGPLDENKPIALMFLKGITTAKERIYIQTPYFLPSSEFIYAIQIASLSGVDVRIILPEHSDSPVLQRASQSYITQMLRSGVKIYFYTAGFMHAKAMVIDNEFTTIGSTNFDFRSFEQNFEINAFIYSRDFNAIYAAEFEKDRKNSRRITLRSWRKRSMWRKVTESVLRLLSPLL